MYVYKRIFAIILSNRGFIIVIYLKQLNLDQNSITDIGSKELMNGAN
jgi:hypothetical protein